MQEWRSADGRVLLMGEPPILAALKAAGAGGDVALEEFSGAERQPRRGRGAHYRLDLTGLHVVAKTLRHGGFLGWLLGRRYLSARRLQDTIALHARLRAAQVECAPLVFARARRSRFGSWFELELGTAELLGAVDLEAYLRSTPDFRAQRLALLAAAHTVHSLHAAGVLHADLNVRNLLVLGGDPPRVAAIDFEGSRQLAALTRAQIAANLERLARSAEKRGLFQGVLEKRAVVRFVREYCGDDWRELFLTVLHRYRRCIGWHRSAWALRRWLGGDERSA